MSVTIRQSICTADWFVGYLITLTVLFIGGTEIGISEN
jgi:hypothetical protein